MSTRSLCGLILAASLAALAGCAAPIDDEDFDGEDLTSEGEESSAEALSTSDFPAPQLSAAAKESILASYDVDKGHVVPRALLADAVAFYDAHKSKLRNKSYLTVVDFSRHSGKKRFFVVNMSSGAVSAHVVAHGSGSDPRGAGTPSRFSNKVNSNQSSLGFYVTGETYVGKHGNSLRLDGVSSTNSNARRRAVVVHGARYVSDGRAKQGTSWGCLALSTSATPGVIRQLKGGSVIYAGQSD